MQDTLKDLFKASFAEGLYEGLFEYKKNIGCIHRSTEIANKALVLLT